jgi:hypothetical protein
VYESQHVLEVLLNVVRQTDDNSENVLDVIRKDMSKLLQDSPSIFERYPLKLQRLFLGLTVMLKKPTDQTLKNLAVICSRSIGGFKQDRYQDRTMMMTNLIVESVHSIRKSISMPAYVAFLIGTIGMAHRLKALNGLLVDTMLVENEEGGGINADSRRKSLDALIEASIMSMDRNLGRMARMLLCSGPPVERIVETMQPQLLSWEKMAQSSKDVAPWEYLVRMRTIFVLKSFFFLSSTTTTTKTHLEGVSMVTLDASEMPNLLESISQYLYCIAANDNVMALFPLLTAPVVALTVAVSTLLEAIFQKVSEWFEPTPVSKSTQINILSIFLEWIKDARLKYTLNENGTTAHLLEHTQRMVQLLGMTDNEPAKKLGQELTIRLDFGNL